MGHGYTTARVVGNAGHAFTRARGFRVIGSAP
jgi:hypothetical protein